MSACLGGQILAVWKGLMENQWEGCAYEQKMGRKRLKGIARCMGGDRNNVSCDSWSLPRCYLSFNWTLRWPGVYAQRVGVCVRELNMDRVTFIMTLQTGWRPDRRVRKKRVRIWKKTWIFIAYLNMHFMFSHGYGSRFDLHQQNIHRFKRENKEEPWFGWKGKKYIKIQQKLVGLLKAWGRLGR